MPKRKNKNQYKAKKQEIDTTTSVKKPSIFKKAVVIVIILSFVITGVLSGLSGMGAF